MYQQAWRGRKRQAHGHHSPSSIQGEWLAIDDQKNNILASICLASYLSSSKLVAKAQNETLFIMQNFFLFLCVCVCICVCLVSQVDLSITKQNYLFVRSQSLSHIPHTSLWYSNQPLWKLNLMTGVNTTKQQTGQIKNTI